MATPPEARCVLEARRADVALAERLWEPIALDDRLDLLITGIAKANAAGATARFLDPDRHAGVVSLGIAGALPGSGLALGTAVVASQSVFADEGLAGPKGFDDCTAMGFGLCPDGGQAIKADEPWATACHQYGLETGIIATVSTCSGTDDRAQAIAQRWSARAEAMEGAAAGLVAGRLGVRFIELRIISNTTGDRNQQVWDLAGAWASLVDLGRRL